MNSNNENILMLHDAERLSAEEIRSLRVGDKVWYSSLLCIPNGYDDELHYGTIKRIVTPAAGRRPIMAADLASPVCGVQCFIIGCWQVVPKNVFKPRKRNASPEAEGDCCKSGDAFDNDLTTKQSSTDDLK